MGAGAIDTRLPDFAEGVFAEQVPDEGVLAGRIGETPVLLARLGGEICAVGGACTHYGAALANGLRTGESIRCPLHHACFSLRSGAAVAAPAFRPLDRYRVERVGDRVFVREAIGAGKARAVQSDPGVRSIVLVGAGAAGYSCAVTLRRLGYDGQLVMLGREPDLPYDRPNLSKDFLAGTAPADWMPLADESFYREQEIELRVGLEVSAIDSSARRVTCASGESVGFDRLLLAPGADPIRLAALDGPGVHTLRSFEDARAIAAAADRAKRALIVGSGFIALEAAAALRTRGLGVEVVTLDNAPFERLLGAEIGGWLQRMHEEQGVRFHNGRTVARFSAGRALLDEGTELATDLLLLGVGVRPRLELARAAGLAVDGGILVDEHLETSAAGIFAAGDAASYLAPRGRRRIEHWVTAQRQGEAVAANMLGRSRAFEHVPFFWTEQYGTALRYVGDAANWSRVETEGRPASGRFTARYFDAGGKLVASASVGRDLDNLRDEVVLEASDARVEAPREPFAAAAI